MNGDLENVKRNDGLDMSKLLNVVNIGKKVVTMDGKWKAVSVVIKILKCCDSSKSRG